MTAIAAGQQTGWNGSAFVMAYRPLARVFVCGQSIEAETMARLAEAAGYAVHRHDTGRAAPEPGSIDADTAVVILLHDIDLELPVLRAALHSRPFYLGALGSSRTHGRRSQRLTELGYSVSDIARIKSPIGIFDKARDAQSLALSVLADLAAYRLSMTR